MFLMANTFPIIWAKSADGLPRPIHRLRYLDLALPEDDECDLHDYLTIQHHATFNFKRADSAEDFLRYVHLADGSTQKVIGIRSPEINVTSIASHPPMGELVKMLNAVTTVMLKKVLPEVSAQWFPEGCWTPVSLPGSQQHDAMATTDASPHVESAPFLSTSSPNDFCAFPTIQASTRPNAGSDIVPAFGELKVALAEHHLPRGVLYEIHDCIKQLPGFEKMGWLSILDENFVDEPMKSTVLKVMHVFCGGVELADLY
ncbi:hypothetical protein BU15DRAFT_74069 [Melanogaster broomeanus]|nr:hypothetical protein BU15DRAFT_74069 [Melanogaster broomeanus]